MLVSCNDGESGEGKPLEEAQTGKLFALLSEELCKYVTEKLRESLGHENWQLFVSSPPPWSAEYTLKVILERWFAVFSDSCLGTISVTSLGKGKQVFSWLYSLRMDFLRGNDLSGDQVRLFTETVQQILIAIRSPFAGLLDKEVSIHSSSAEEAMDVDRILLPYPGNDEGAEIGDQDEADSSIWLNWKKKNIKPLIVLDGANIGWKHGKNQKFSPLGIVLAFEFFNQRKLDCVCFLPETYWQRVDASPTSSVWTWLSFWRDSGQLILTPASDYDDSYMLYYAQTHGGLIVSNDGFLDYMEQTNIDWQKRSLAKWLSHCRITFVFRDNEFIPNPSFHIEAAWEYICQSLRHNDTSPNQV